MYPIIPQPEVENRFLEAVAAVEELVKKGCTHAEAVAIQSKHYGLDYRGLMEYFRE